MNQKIGNVQQDIFTIQEFSELIVSKGLEKGRYEIDVSDSGEIKMSIIKKRWIQREDLTK